VIREKNIRAPLVRTPPPCPTQPPIGMSELEQYEFGGYRSVTPQDGLVVVVGTPRPIPGSSVPPPAPPQLTLWTDINLSGSALELQPGESYRDFTDIGWWVFAMDWNDKISSIGPTSSLCMVFEHTHSQGSSLFVGPSGTSWLNLHSLGWGDRISSVINGG